MKEQRTNCGTMDGALLIGEVARRTGVPAKTIRYYEQIGLLPPPARRDTGYASAGYRLFGEADVQRLEFVKRARMLELPLRCIGDLLEAVEEGCCAAARPELRAVVDAKLPEVDARLMELTRLREDLLRLGAAVDAEPGAPADERAPACAAADDPATCAFGPDSGARSAGCSGPSPAR